MKLNLKPGLILILVASALTAVFGQQEPSPFDFGKMWTFENPPKEWFAKAYHQEFDQHWFDEGREASLRFASWCSASFVSPNGLVMTNHHCSRDVVADLSKEGEDLDKNGFYAATYADERRHNDLFVDQLVNVAIVTDKIKAVTAQAKTDEERLTKTKEASDAVMREYQSKPGWENLRLQLVTYYSGAKYSLYGYKRYNDVRLVFFPETEMGFFGGDPDNFTYPRYDLDCSFWRVYDENGKPLNTSENYFKFNTDGVQDGTPVFVIGNPGSTERYRTVSQLEFDRDYRYPVDVRFFTDHMNQLQAEYDKHPSVELMNEVFSLSNTLKATKGALDGLNNPDLFARKVKMEQKLRASAAGKTYWDDLAKYYSTLNHHTAELRFLSPNPYNGGVLPLMYTIDDYIKTATANPESPELEGLEKQIAEMAHVVNDPAEEKTLGLILQEVKDFSQSDDQYINAILDGRTPDAAAKEILAKTIFADEKDLNKLLDKSTKKFLKKKDPLIEAATLLAKEYNDAVMAYQSTATVRKGIEQQVAAEAFKVYGDALPPDATFTLRISDGVVRGYEYNGTQAPIKTTFFGMYDRSASNDNKFPWALPARWANPPLELLKAPLNFICTADIIGGNSGSPVINANREVVGLVFDGNIESLPGKFIFDEEKNRTVAVHVGGIVAALRYIYKADRLVGELTGK